MNPHVKTLKEFAEWWLPELAVAVVSPVAIAFVAAFTSTFMPSVAGGLTALLLLVPLAAVLRIAIGAGLQHRRAKEHQRLGRELDRIALERQAAATEQTGDDEVVDAELIEVREVAA